MTIGGNTGQIQRLRNFSEIPLTFNHTLVKRTHENVARVGMLDF
jgi:hypothetical protein